MQDELKREKELHEMTRTRMNDLNVEFSKEIEVLKRVVADKEAEISR